MLMKMKEDSNIKIKENLNIKMLNILNNYTSINNK